MKLGIILIFIISFALSQVSKPAIPPSFKLEAVRKSIIPTLHLPRVDEQKLHQEDRMERMRDNQKLIPPRFAVPISVNINIRRDGLWEPLPDGSHLWRLRVVSPGAKATYLIFARYRVPEGASLFVIDSKKKRYIGAFTNQNNKEHFKFSTHPINGEEFIIEYHEPLQVAGQGEIIIETVMHVYKNAFSEIQEPNLMNNRSGLCNINVACGVAHEWKNQIRSVAAIMTGTFGRVCTGAMINSATSERKQYFLTAHHCLMGGNPNNWIAVFNYESATCERGGDRHLKHTVSGLKVVAQFPDTDFLLMEIEEKIPADYNVYLSGWSAVDIPETKMAVGIHHPSGDVKKISFTFLPLNSTRWSREFEGSHWMVQRWTNGTTEPGSSGSPLFDSQKRIVGQLHGGSASCFASNGWDSYGKIAKSFDVGKTKESRLRDWLDPENKGIRVLDGRELYDR